uniref:Protein FAM50 homolog n=1 Tax=Plectus sambesii TaxID=2011161 RepID=A0A914UIU6_9BILA
MPTDQLPELEPDVELGLLETSSLNLLEDYSVAAPSIECGTSVPSVHSVRTARKVVLRGVRRTRTLIKNILSDFKLFIVIMLYSVMGAGLFMWIEIPSNLSHKQEALEYHLTARDTLLSRLRMIYKHDGEDRENRWKEAILDYENAIGIQEPIVETDWTFWMSFLYAGTIFTTIGYGNIACKTITGQVLTICYAIIGIPLMLIVLNNLSKVLLKFIQTMSNYIGDIILYIGLRLGIYKFDPSRPPHFHMPAVSRRVVTLGVFSAPVDLYEYSSADSTKATEKDIEANPPVVGAIIFTIGWLFLCAGIFCIWEDWTYWTSFYFFFISLTTIGFGDVSPAHPEYMFMTFGVVLIGLALVSVCINVVQEKLSQLYMGVLEKLMEDYSKAAEQGDQTAAVKGMMAGFQDQAKFLMPLMSKSQGAKVMTQFKDKAKAQGIDLPPVMTDIDPETGMPAFAKAKTEDFAQYIEKANEQAKPPEVKMVEVQTEIESDVKSTQHEILWSTAQSQTTDFDRAESEHCESQTAFSYFALQDNFSQHEEEVVSVEVQSEFPIFNYTSSDVQSDSLTFLMQDASTQQTIVLPELKSTSSQATLIICTEMDAQTEPPPETVDSGIQPELSIIFVPNEETDQLSNTESGNKQLGRFLRQISTQTDQETRDTKRSEFKRAKNGDLAIVFSYWNGSGHRRDTQIKEDSTIGQFLAKVLEILRKDFTELKVVKAENLMFVKADSIIPHFYTFQDIIATKAMGKTGPLYEFDARLETDDVAQETTESHSTKIVLRSWYEKNQQTVPASTWEPFVPNKKYKPIDDLKTKTRRSSLLV